MKKAYIVAYNPLFFLKTKVYKQVHWPYYLVQAHAKILLNIKLVRMRPMKDKMKGTIIIFLLFFILTLTSCNTAANKTPVGSATTNTPTSQTQEHAALKNHPLLGMLNYRNPTPVAKYDVVVVGSEPEGIMASIAAAREGQTTLLIDKKPSVGGLYTLGKLNMIDINWLPSKESVNKGLFLEFYKKINHRTSFDINLAQQVFEKMLRDEKNITVQLGAQTIHPIMDKNHVQALVYKDAYGVVKKVVGKQFIDSTPDADFAELAGAHFTIGQEDFRGEPKMMAVTLLFELSGVDWKKVQNSLNSDGEIYSGADQFSAWGYGKVMKQYVPNHKNVRMRALNIGRQDNGHVLINAFQIVGINGLNNDELLIARGIANDELPKVTNFLRKHLIGFEHAKLVSIADEVYVRETRHLDAEYRLTVDDVLENRDFPDRIAFGSYPVDMQAATLAEGDIIVGNPDQYAIPFRSIVLKGFDNLLVASRSAGYDSLAHGSARTVPIGMTVGQAAGVASAYANQEKIDFQTLIGDSGHMQSIQATLNRNGAGLEPIPQYRNPIVQHWAYKGVKFLRSFGLIEAGYDNQYDMEKPLSKGKFIESIRKVAQYTKATFPLEFPFAADDQPLTKEALVNFLSANAVSLDSLTPTTVEQLQKESTVSRAVAYMAIRELFEEKAPRIFEK